MKETNMQTFFKKHIQNHPPSDSEVYELKICKGTSLPFDSVKEHQLQALSDVEGKGLFYKITDPPIFYGGQMRFNVPRPFDCMYLVRLKSYVVVWFYRAREKKMYIKIPTKVFIKEKESSVRKSLTYERALEIGTIFYLDIHEQ